MDGCSTAAETAPAIVPASGFCESISRDACLRNEVLPLSREGTARAGVCFRGNTSACGTTRSSSRCAPVVLSGQILGPLLGEFASAQSRGLTDFDQVPVGVPHVAANLSTAIDRRRHKLGPF